MASLLKVLTYNIHKGFNAGNREFTLHGLKDAIEEVDADLVFLQEITGEHQRHQHTYPGWPEAGQQAFLASRLWPHSAYGKNAIYKLGHHGNAILSKHAFVDWENINVSFMKKASRSLLHGVIDLQDHSIKLHVICVHLGLFEFERRRQLAVLVERIEKHVPHDEPLIIAGDFNDWRINADKYFKQLLDVVEVHKASHGRYAKTFPAWLPVFSMDRIYSRGLTIDSCDVLSAPVWRHLSDHLPIEACFNI